MIFIKAKFVTKVDLISSLDNELKSFLNYVDYTRINELINQMRDVSFLIENPYIDDVYRDNYYLYYSSKLNKYERNVIRVHIIDTSDISDIADEEKIQQFYLGYFVVRPLSVHPLGRSFISPNAFKKHNYSICTCSLKCNFFGCDLEIQGFPHIVQDSESHTCAESSMWALDSYFGTKFPIYRKQEMSEILEKLHSFSARRLLPSQGLSLLEIASALNSLGQNCITYPVEDNESFNIMQIYIESGMPFLLSLENEEHSIGHAILAIGHEKIDYDNVILEFAKDKKICWHSISSFNKKLVYIDDNFSPYTVDNCKGNQERYLKCWGNTKITSFVVPLHKHMYLEAAGAFNIIKTFFDDPVNGLHTFGKRFITRLFLTNSSSFKQVLKDDCLISDIYKNLILSTLFPKFIWICEIYDENEYSSEKCCGIIVLDATESSEYTSLMYYFLFDSIFCFANGKLSRIKTKSSFEKNMYKHNLQEA